MFDSHQLFADAMRFKPMYLGKAYRIISQANLSNAFQLSPATSTESSTQNWKHTNAISDGDCFNICNFADDFKVHRGALCQAYLQDSTDAQQELK